MTEGELRARAALFVEEYPGFDGDAATAATEAAMRAADRLVEAIERLNEASGKKNRKHQARAIDELKAAVGDLARTNAKAAGETKAAIACANFAQAFYEDLSDNL